MKASTLPDEGLVEVEGVETTVSIISGPVVYSCARGLLTFQLNDQYRDRLNMTLHIHYDTGQG